MVHRKPGDHLTIMVKSVRRWCRGLRASLLSYCCRAVYFHGFAAPLKTCMLQALALACNGTYIIEQPRQSLLNRHRRFRWLSRASRVYRSCWWMGLYSDPEKDEDWTPKRQISWSNSRYIWAFNNGQLRRGPGTPKSKASRRYRDASGRLRWNGTKK